MGIEPTTRALRKHCSTTEPLRLERDTRIGLAALPWEGSVLPLYKSRRSIIFYQILVYLRLMAYRYHSRRSVKRIARRSRRNFLITLIIIAVLAYSTVTWVLPSFINSIGFVKNVIKPPQRTLSQSSENTALAPPVLNIPYEATNTAQIDIKGFGTPNSKIKLFIDDDPKQTISVSSDGSFDFEKVLLNLGTNNIYGKTIDERGSESLPSKEVKLIYINEKPSLNINEPEDGKKIQGGDKKVKVSGKTDPGVQVFVSGNQVIVDRDGNFSIDLNLDEGDNTISIKAVDAASNSIEIQRRVNYTP